MSRVLCTTLGLLLGLLSTVATQAAEPALRVEVQASQPVLVGQQVQIDVTVAAPNFFTSAPPFPPLAVPGAIVTMPDERGQNGVEQVGGETLATITKSYQFAAQQAGDFSLPPVKIEFSYGGDDGKPRSASLTLPPTRITARQPEGAAAPGGAALPVARLTIRQVFDRSTDGLKAGDALVRSIEISAARTQAMLIPPPRFEAPDGVRVFVADPQLSDENPSGGGGFVGGTRTDRATYVFEKAGRYTLPAIEVKWFDPASRRPMSTQAPAVTVHVAAAAHRGEAIAPEVPALGVDPAPRRPIDWASLAVQAVSLILLAALSWWGHGQWLRWQARRNARRQAQAASDGAMFRQVLDASAQGDARRTHAALLAWCSAHAGAAPHAWAAQLQDTALGAQIEALQRQLYGGATTASGGTTPWSGGACAAALRAAHRQWRAVRPAPTNRRWRQHALGPLNPFRSSNSKA
ncbi:BatD family protein [Variovorax sp. LARHSF232]